MLLEVAGVPYTGFESAQLNLDDFVKVGSPFETVRMYDSHEED